MSAKQKDVSSSPSHDQKYFCAGFFGLVRLYFTNFFNVSKGSPLHFFPILQKSGCSKTPEAPFHIFRHYATYRRPKNFRKKFRKKISKKFGFVFQFFLTRVL